MDKSKAIEGKEESQPDFLIKLKNRLSQFSMVLDHSPSSIIIADKDGKIEYANLRFQTVTGLKEETIIGEDIKNTSLLDLSAPEFEDLLNTVGGGATWYDERSIQDKDDNTVWESISVKPIKNHADEVTHFLVVVDDITKRKNTELELSRLASFPMFSPGPIVETDYSGIITYLNPAAITSFSHSMKMHQRYPFIKDMTSVVSAARNAKKGYVIREVVVRNKVYEQHISCVPNIGRIRIYFTDITERKRVDNLKNEFVSTVSHELRTPLSITKEGICLLLDQVTGEINYEQEKVLKTANANLDRLVRLVNNLLDLSRIESGALVLKRAMTDMVKITRQTVESFRPKLLERNLTLDVVLPNKGVWLYIDEDRIVQVLVNLIGNAIKFTLHGGIRVAVIEEDKKITCSVADTGKGIQNSEQVKIFDKFLQFGAPQNPHEKGSGLGLSIAKGIIEMHDGKIWAESIAGHGSTFSFTLPKYTAYELFMRQLQFSLKSAEERDISLSLVLVTCDLSSANPEMSMESVHGFGDRVEAEIKRCLRGSRDVVLNLDSQAAVILDDCDKNSASQVIQRIAESISELFIRHGMNNLVSLKFGKATYPEDAKDAKSVIVIAEKNSTWWKKAKTQGKNRKS